MPLTERTIRIVLHHQEGCALLDIEIKHIDNMRMLEGCNGVRFLLEGLNVLLRDTGIQNLDGCESLLKPQMLSQIDGGLTSFSNQTEQPIAAKLLIAKVCHRRLSSQHNVLMHLRREIQTIKMLCAWSHITFAHRIQNAIALVE